MGRWAVLSILVLVAGILCGLSIWHSAWAPTAAIVGDGTASGEYGLDLEVGAVPGRWRRSPWSQTPGKGRSHNCSREEMNNPGTCERRLFRQDVESAADIRLKGSLFRACRRDKKKFCPDTAPGEARVLDCLEKHRLDPDFSPECKGEFDKMMLRRAEDWRLHYSLFKSCKSEYDNFCYAVDTDDVNDTPNEEVLACLHGYRDRFESTACRQQVRQLTKLAAEDIRFDQPLASSCEEDRTTTCKEMPDGMGRVFRCLQDNRAKLHDLCRSALSTQEVRMAQDMGFAFSMTAGCEGERNTLCGTVWEEYNGQAAVIKCLQENLEQPGMGANCRAAIQDDERRWIHEIQRSQLQWWGQERDLKSYGNEKGGGASA